MMTPLQSALAAAAGFPASDPVPAVEYRSAGRVLAIGPLPLLDAVAARLPGRPLTLLDEATCSVVAMHGWLGAFSVAWNSGGSTHEGAFDLVLNLTGNPYFRMHQPPQGYFAPGEDAAARDLAIAEIQDAVGEFEKPKFFRYHENTCAHSRSRLQGCDRCIAVCSTEAISADGDRVRVEPHLCMGCGACATVCPSGAMQYNFPSVSYWGGKLQAILAAYHAAGGEDARLLLHNPGEGAALVRETDLPANVIPLEVYHIASIGLDALLGALALGAGQVAVLSTGSEAPQYLAALRQQMGYGEEILQGLGYGDGHFHLVEAADAAMLGTVMQVLVPAVVPQQRASFRLFDEKRTTLEYCIVHFSRQAPRAQEQIALSAGAPFGQVSVNGQVCTLCLACVGACPASALQDGAGAPMLKFVERNCIQCGLCENACPENAIELQPRLLLTAEAKQARILHQDTPFHCVQCGRPFATTHMVGAMLHKLAGHSMFSTPEAKRRLQMCGECRVKDMVAADMGATTR